MQQKRSYHYFKPGDLTGLETCLNAMSRDGWQAVKPGRFVQCYARGAGVFVHRFGWCEARPGSAGEIRWLAAQERAGWSVAARRRGWVLFRKPAAEAAEGETLDGHRETVQALFARRIARLERLRRWMLVLASILLVGGYASSLLPILYATALPMAAALFVTYRIKFMEEGLGK